MPKPKSRLKSLKAEEESQHGAKKNLASVFIKISEVENLKYLGDSDFVKFEISGKFQGNKISNGGSGRFNALDDVELAFEIKIDIDDEADVLTLFANPVQCKFV